MTAPPIERVLGPALPLSPAPARRASSHAPRRAGRFGTELPRPRRPAPADEAYTGEAYTDEAYTGAAPRAAGLPRLPGWVVERALAEGAQAEVFVVRQAGARPEAPVHASPEPRARTAPGT